MLDCTPMQAGIPKYTATKRGLSALAALTWPLQVSEEQIWAAREVGKKKLATSYRHRKRCHSEYL
jgi:hypothetical protein